MDIITNPIDLDHDSKNGAAFLRIEGKELFSLGFEFGDSVDVKFSNGKSILDIPFFDGYYAEAGTVILCAYPGNPYTKVVECFGRHFWEQSQLQDEDTAVILLREKGKYKTIQEVFSLKYSCDPADFATDEVFANFRALKGGRLKKNQFYRSASVINNKFNRAEAADRLLIKNGIEYVINLSETDAEIQKALIDKVENEGFERLYAEKKCLALDMSCDYRSKENRNKIIEAFRRILEVKKKVLIHCVEGKDRTGFICLLMEALASAGYTELREDYLKTFENYYGETSNMITVFEELLLLPQLAFLAGVYEKEELEKTDYKDCAIRYLSSGGMEENEIKEFIKYIEEK